MTNDPRYVLDTSAILTLIELEGGFERVEKILRNDQTILPWVVLLEVVYITRRQQGAAEADRRYALLRESPAKLLWDINEPLLLTAARLKAEHRISFADSLILAYTVRQRAILIHKDPEFDALADTIPQEHLPYKTK